MNHSSDFLPIDVVIERLHDINLLNSDISLRVVEIMNSGFVVSPDLLFRNIISVLPYQENIKLFILMYLRDMKTKDEILDLLRPMETTFWKLLKALKKYGIDQREVAEWAKSSPARISSIKKWSRKITQSMLDDIFLQERYKKLFETVDEIRQLHNELWV